MARTKFPAKQRPQGTPSKRTIHAEKKEPLRGHNERIIEEMMEEVDAALSKIARSRDLVYKRQGTATYKKCFVFYPQFHFKWRNDID